MIHTYAVRVDVLRNGGRVTSLQPASAPTIDCNADAAIKTSMSGVFYPNDLAEYLSDELMPVQIIDGVESPAGIYLPTTPKGSVDENGAPTVSIEAYDRGLILQQDKLEQPLFFPAGTNYITAVGEILLGAGIENALVTATEAVLATDHEWQLGTDKLTIVNGLLEEINYDPIWFNAYGVAVVQPHRTPSPDQIDHQYTPGTGDLYRETAWETDAFDAANVFVVQCSNPDLEEPLTAVSVNDSPTSALSVFRRGRRIVQVSNVDNIADQSALQDYADRLRLQSMQSYDTVTLYTANKPGHGVRDTVAVVHPEAGGLYQEIAWSLILEPGAKMYHKLQKAVIL